MKRGFYLLLVLGVLWIPTVAAAAPVKNSIEVGGWMPYWRAASSTQNTSANLGNLTTVHPFAFYVSSEGDLHDNLRITEEPWAGFVRQAQAQKVRVIPSIMWADGEAIHRILSDDDERDELIEDIVELVEGNGFDGIDIDFESKLAETNEYFSTFLRELYQEIGNKWVYCTIESRTPLSSRYDTIPGNIEYANDYVEINKYCDRVQIMAYDQGTIDLQLSRAAAGPYTPIADVRWTEKVLREAMKSIDNRKLVLGIPTYGYEYQVAPLSASTYSYERLWSFNPNYALDVATKLGLTPTRNSAGELQVLYLPQMLSNGKPVNDATSSNLGVPATALSNVATAPTVRTTFNMMTWGDSVSVQQKIDMAKRLGVRGVAIFKFDGGQDQKIWDVLAGK